MIDLREVDLEDLEKQIALERNRRMEEALTAKENVCVITLQPGFSGSAGVVAYCVGRCIEGEDSDDEGTKWGGSYFMFADYPNGKARWLVEPHRLGVMLKLYGKTH